MASSSRAMVQLVNSLACQKSVVTLKAGSFRYSN
jgi:hypothetical protein